MYTCITCSKSFTFPGNLSRHKAVHEAPNIICSGCGSAFTRYDNLQRHVIKCTAIGPDTSLDDSINDESTKERDTCLRVSTPSSLANVVTTPTAEACPSVVDNLPPLKNKFDASLELSRRKVVKHPVKTKSDSQSDNSSNESDS